MESMFRLKQDYLTKNKTANPTLEMKDRQF
jgi:hypothetical protein